MRAILPLVLLAALAAPLGAQSVVYTPPDSAARADSDATAADGAQADSAAARPAAVQRTDSLVARPDSAVRQVDTTAGRSDTAAAIGDTTAAAPDTAAARQDTAAGAADTTRRTADTVSAGATSDTATAVDTSLTARMDVRRGGAMRGLARMTLIEAVRVGGLGLSTFARLVDAAGWTRRLASGGPYTVLAPTDAAFAALPSGELEATLRDRARADRLVRAHLVPAGVLLSGTAGGGTIRRLEGPPLSASVNGDTLFVDGARVVRADVGVSNGVIQILDAILPPGP